MNEEIKNNKVVEEINPVDEYLNIYKEQKLAEFCVQKDKEIASYKKERQKLMEQISSMKVTVKQHDEAWKNMDNLYAEIKKLSVTEANRALEYFLSQNTFIVRKRVVQHD